MRTDKVRPQEGLMPGELLVRVPPRASAQSSISVQQLGWGRGGVRVRKSQFKRGGHKWGRKAKI